MTNDETMTKAYNKNQEDILQLRRLKEILNVFIELGHAKDNRRMCDYMLYIKNVVDEAIESIMGEFN
jgi:hypothetical protein